MLNHMNVCGILVVNTPDRPLRNYVVLACADEIAINGKTTAVWYYADTDSREKAESLTKQADNLFMVDSRR